MGSDQRALDFLDQIALKQPEQLSPPGILPARQPLLMRDPNHRKRQLVEDLIFAGDVQLQISPSGKEGFEMLLAVRFNGDDADCFGQGRATGDDVEAQGRFREDDLIGMDDHREAESIGVRPAAPIGGFNLNRDQREGRGLDERADVAGVHGNGRQLRSAAGQKPPEHSPSV